MNGQRTSGTAVMDSSEILPELPLDVRREILLVTLRHVINIVPFFKVCGFA